MTATNHALTGAAIGFLVGEPLVAIPMAIASHFICDTLPHYGSRDVTGKHIASRRFRNYLLADAFLCFLLVLVIFAFQPYNWLIAIVCAFLATAPDFGWINKFKKARQGKPWRQNLFTKFASRIQWFQRPIGWVVEAVWAVCFIVIIAPFLK